jgi:hypothetical protein
MTVYALQLAHEELPILGRQLEAVLDCQSPLIYWHCCRHATCISSDSSSCMSRPDLCNNPEITPSGFQEILNVLFSGSLTPSYHRNWRSEDAASRAITSC